MTAQDRVLWWVLTRGGDDGNDVNIISDIEIAVDNWANKKTIETVEDIKRIIIENKDLLLKQKEYKYV